MTPTLATRRSLLLTAASAAALLLGGCAASMSAGPAAPARPAMNAAALQKLDDLVTRDAAAGRVPGVVMLLWRDGKVVHDKAIGILDPNKPASPMPADAIFRIYSMSKPIVSVGAMMLVED